MVKKNGHFRECGTVREVWMQYLFQLGVRDAKLPAPDSGYMFDGGVFERAANGVSADHPSRAHDYKSLLTRSRNVYRSPRDAANALIKA
jgi:hypothetical protein